MLLKTFIAALVLKSLLLAALFMVDAQEDLGNILSGPQNRTVALGEIVYFNCHARGISVYWLINNAISDPANYITRGFTFINQDIFAPAPSSNQLGEYNDTVIIEARPSNNNTHIACHARGQQHGQYDMVEAILIIVGPPLAPPVNLTQHHLINDAIQHIISWSAPFTWSQYPITNYTININNHHGEYITVVKPSDNFIYTHTSYGKNCYQLDVSLAASSQIGQGSASSIHSGHPVISDEEVLVETTAAVLSNVTVALNISVLVPFVCPGYQIATYSILIHDESSHQLALFGPIVYKQLNDTENKTLIKQEVHLNHTQFYEIEVSFDRNGFLISNNTRIRLSGELYAKTLSAVTVTNSEAQITGTGSVQKSTSNIPAIATGSTVGGIVLVAPFTFIIIITCISYKRKRRSLTTSESGGYNNHLRVQTLERPSNLKLQESNPIYDGAVYETMPGESFKALLSPTSTPTTPATDSATRYLFDTNVLPNLPPPRKESAGQMPILDSDKEKVLLNGAEMPNLISNDAMEYMIMQNTSSVSNEVKTMGDI